MIGFAALFAIAAPGAAPETPAAGRTPPPSYFMSGDYPPAAIRAGEEGTVRFELLVNAQGRVADCTILSSSGSEALDAATCRILRSRARFTPARNAAGAPVPDIVRSQVTWRLPPPPAPEPPPPQ